MWTTLERSTKGMPRTKKQHYVPQFLLRNFATGSRKTPKLWTLDKSTQNIRYSSVREVGHENLFYEHHDQDGSRAELEDLMMRIDSIGAEIIGRILKESSLQLLSEDFEWLSYFVACQMLRTPMVRKDMENIREMVIRKWGPNVRAGDDLRTVGEYGTEDSKLSSLLLLRDVPEFANLLQTKVWTLEKAPKESTFIIGDNPVSRYNMIDRCPRGNLGLNSTGIELYMPLSPRYSIHIICPALAENFLRMDGVAEAYSNAINRGIPVQLQPENVVFANSQQVIWAERFVFGREKIDLSLPIDMLLTNPELVSGPGVRQCPEEV